MHFRGKARVIRKCAERVDCRVNEYTRDKATAAVKDSDQQKTDRDRKDDLAQVIDKIHSASVEQVDDMSDSESYA